MPRPKTGLPSTESGLARTRAKLVDKPNRRAEVRWNHRLLPVLGVAVFSLCLSAVGCGENVSPEARLQKTILTLEVGPGPSDPGGLTEIHQIVSEMGDAKAVSVMANLYEECQAVEDKVRIAMASKVLRRTKKTATTKAWAQELAENLLNERSAGLVNLGLQQLALGAESERLVLQRLKTAETEAVRDHLLVWLATRGDFRSIVSELGAAPSEKADAQARAAWRNQVWQVLDAYASAALGSGALPAEFGPTVGEIIIADPGMVEYGVCVLLDACAPERSVHVLQEVRQALAEDSLARLWVDAGLMILEKDASPNGSTSLLDGLRTTAHRYAQGDECWLELVVRTRSLVFASARTQDSNLLEVLWNALSDLKKRDRAELLWLMSRLCWHRGTNEFILLLNGVPAKELRHMHALFPYGTGQIEALLSLSPLRPLPDSVSRRQMNATAQRVRDMAPFMPRERIARKTAYSLDIYSQVTLKND